MKVLSLFDGISCGQLALGDTPEVYYASEIDPVAIKVTQEHFPNTIQVGDVNTLKPQDFGEIDLLLAGSPCQDLSRGNHQGKGLLGVKSSLFYEFYRLLQGIQPRYFLLENVPMKHHFEQEITDLLGVKPLKINSNIVSCQNRSRLYWTNIPGVFAPQNPCDLTLNDVLLEEFSDWKTFEIPGTFCFTKNYVKWGQSQNQRAYFPERKIGTLMASGGSSKSNIYLGSNKARRLHPEEAELCQTLPKGYTSAAPSISKRFNLIGNAWTVDVVVNLIKNVKENL